jgi:Holliday junction resolvase RusA-like endonuclease
MTFEVIGQPATKGSARAFPYRKPTGALGVRVAADNPTLRTWETRVRADAVAAMQRVGEDLITRPSAIRLVATFRLPRPLKYATPQYRAGRRSAPAHSVRPDLDKMIRALSDALRGAIYEDDAQVAQLLVTKRYALIGESWGVEVTVERFEEPHHAQENGKKDADEGAPHRAENRQARRRA